MYKRFFKYIKTFSCNFYNFYNSYNFYKFSCVFSNINVYPPVYIWIFYISIFLYKYFLYKYFLYFLYFLYMRILHVFICIYLFIHCIFSVIPRQEKTNYKHPVKWEMTKECHLNWVWLIGRLQCSKTNYAYYIGFS